MNKINKIVTFISFLIILFGIFSVFNYYSKARIINFDNSTDVSFMPNEKEQNIGSSTNDLNKLDQSLVEYKLISNINCSISIKSQAGLGIILENNQIFFSKNTQQRFPIASLTKLMTAVISVEKIPKSSLITITSKAQAAFGDFGNFKTGERYSREDLLKGMLLSSSNDAAVALAEQIGYKDFVHLMNEKAKELEMTETLFVDPAGLSLNNRFSIEDLSTLVKYILANYPQIFEWTRNDKIFIYDVANDQEKIIFNENKLAKENNFLGGKTGFLLTPNKGGLISLFRYRDYTILIIVLDGNWYDRYQDTKNILSCLPD